MRPAFSAILLLCAAGCGQLRGRPLPVAPAGPTRLERDINAGPAVKPPSATPGPPAVDAPRDPAMRPASLEVPASSKPPAQAVDATQLKSSLTIDPDIGPVQGPPLGIVARVGDGYVTWEDLAAGVREVRESEHIPPGQTLSPETQNQIASVALNKLIERAMLLERLKERFKKKDKEFAAFEKHVNEQFAEKELPTLLKTYKVANAAELDAAMTKAGASLEQKRKTFRDDQMSYEYLMMSLQPRFKPSLMECQLYYAKNREKYPMSAQVSWREVVVAPGPGAREKAEAIRARLARGEDMAKVAKAESAGSTAAEGGLWKTAPGSHVSAGINEALAAQPLKKVGAVIEANDGFHVVRVEGRREAGIRPYSEVQREVARTVLEQNYQREVTAFLDNLKAQTVITTKFDGTASAPRLTRN